MKNKIKRFICGFLYCISEVLFKGKHNKNKGKTRILVFHHIDHPKRFDKALEKISSRYNLISWDDYLNGNLSKSRVNVIISLDDGYESWFTHGLPVFIKYNVKPILSINSDFIGLDEGESFHYCQNHINTWGEKSLSWEQLIELKKHGSTIFSHSHYHTDMKDPNIELSFKRDAILKDKVKIIEKINVDVSGFTYPYGCYSDLSVTLVGELGFKYALTSDSNFLSSGQFPLLIGRTNVGMRHWIVVFSYIEGWSERLTNCMFKIRRIF
ncbi:MULTISPECIES: polysaccharide deacetylase family protein [Vibrio]|uniref:polysaccharide deacetylase family protein n=1 Tax=Vibrio TaxID=662 RepID=UPI0022B0024B|nr:polysaccharide deacetylase family protein [Vibrio atlanticus]MCZ4310106.1 polysaccharide deacetylase family protein [Vibrio atlanticus]